MSNKNADDAFSTVMTFAFCVGIVMFIVAWINNELPPWIMHLISGMLHASPTGGK